MHDLLGLVRFRLFAIGVFEDAWSKANFRFG